ncbi:MAG: PTS mannitol transporter subunit IIBC, partial [Clostridiales bacterium]|nr:PTS mannitol transporter subunit IIBC [Clostridiales bacterium]
GVGLGILLSYSVFGKGVSKKTAPGAIIIHFFGGIAEIYFPYVLMNPLLLIPAIIGGMSGIATLMLTNVGMISPASPGSIFAFMAVTPRGSHFGILLAIAVATAVTFVGASIVHKLTRNDATDDDFDTANSKSKEMKQAGKKELAVKDVSANVTAGDGVSGKNKITKIIFACDAGMGSSAMGASMVRNLVKKAGMDLDVTHQAVSELSADKNTLVITQKELLARAMKQAPEADFFAVEQFIQKEQYEKVLEDIRGQSRE